METKKRTIIDFGIDIKSATEDATSDVQAYKSIVEKMTDTFIAKNHDYGNSFSESVKELGFIVGFAPIMHKFNRLKNIIKGTSPMVEGETIEDTLLDLANYCIMLKMEYERV